MRTFTFLLLLAFFSAPALAESLRFTLVNSSDGLPQNSIRAISQDKNGLMWFATEDGLARYDGQNIKVYTHQPTEVLTLKENVANRFVANGQQLWIATQGEGAVSVLDQTKQTFHPLKAMTNESSSAEPLGNVAFALYQRAENEMLVGSTNGIFSVAMDSLTVQKQLISTSQLNNKQSISGIWEDSNNNVWFASGDGKLGFVNDDGTIKEIAFEGEIFRFKRIPALGDILVTDKGLMKLDYEKQQLTHLFTDAAFKGMKFRDIVQSDDGIVWIATRSGLIRYDANNDVAFLAEKTLADENSLPSNELETLYISKDGTLWIGTVDKGIAHTNIKGFGFTSFSTHNLKIIHPPQAGNKVSSFKNNMIWSIFRDSRDTLWIGSSEGLSRQEKGEGTYTNLESLGTEAQTVDIATSWIMTINEADGYLWFGTWGEGLIRYDRDTQETVVFLKDAEDASTRVSGNIIRLLQFDKIRSALWIGTHRNGLNKLDFSSGEITQYLPDPQNPNAFPHMRSRALHLDKQNRLWVGTGDGIALFDETTGHFKRVKKYPSGEATTDIRGLYQTDDNTLWSATGFGLDRVNIEKMEVEQKFLEEDGLSRTALYGLFADKKGDIWIPTTRGLTRFNPKDTTFKRYFIGHNLQANEFNFNAGLVEKDGTVLLGGVGGITVFKPSEVTEIKDTYQPVVLSIKSIDNDFVEQIALGVSGTRSTKELAFTLDANQRSVVIDFVIPEYAFADGLEYEYKLLGSQNSWLSAKPRDTPIRYTNLKAGKYVFAVRKADATDPSEQQKLKIRFKIEKHWWEIHWVRFLLSVLIGLLGIYLIRIFSNYKLEKQIAQERSDLYNMVVHDLGPALKRTRDDIKSLKNRSAHSGKGSDDERDELLNGLDSDNQYSLTFINQLRAVSSVEGFAQQQKHTFLLEDIVDESVNSFRLDEKILTVTNIPDCSVRVFENSIEFILNNLISNALKYSENGKTIVVDIQQEAKRNIIISVADNGAGISESFKKQVFKPYQRGDYYKADGLGLGLTLVKSIAEKYQGDISIKDNEPQGTIMQVTLKNIVVSE